MFNTSFARQCGAVLAEAFFVGKHATLQKLGAFQAGIVLCQESFVFCKKKYKNKQNYVYVFFHCFVLWPFYVST